MNLSENNWMNLLKAAEYLDFILFLEDKLGIDKMEALFLDYYNKEEQP